MTSGPAAQRLELDNGVGAAESQPENWKFGAIYYAKNDKRFVVPRTSGIGWTVKFRKAAYLGTVGWIALLDCLHDGNLNSHNTLATCGDVLFDGRETEGQGIQVKAVAPLESPLQHPQSERQPGPVCSKQQPCRGYTTCIDHVRRRE